MFAQPPLKKGACIHTGRAVRLEKNQVAQVLTIALAFASAKEVVEAAFKQIRRAGVAGNVTAQLAIRLVGAHDHGQRVPANDRAQPLFDGQIAWKHTLLLHGHRIDIGRIQVGLPAYALRTGHPNDFLEQVPCSFGPLCRHQSREGVAPFSGLFGVGVKNIGHLQLGVGYRGIHGLDSRRLREKCDAVHTIMARHGSTICF